MALNFLTSTRSAAAFRALTFGMSASILAYPAALCALPKNSGSDVHIWHLDSNRCVGEAGRLVFQGAKEWQSYWDKSSDRCHTQPAHPHTIDFSSYTVLAAFGGLKSNTGYSVRIEKIVEYQDHLEAFIHSTAPGSGCAVGRAQTYPSDMVLFPKISKAVVFKETKTAYNCSYDDRRDPRTGCAEFGGVWGDSESRSDPEGTNYPERCHLGWISRFKAKAKIRKLPEFKNFIQASGADERASFVKYYEDPAVSVVLYLTLPGPSGDCSLKLQGHISRDQRAQVDNLPGSGVAQAVAAIKQDPAYKIWKSNTPEPYGCTVNLGEDTVSVDLFSPRLHPANDFSRHYGERHSAFIGFSYSIPIKNLVMCSNKAGQ